MKGQVRTTGRKLKRLIEEEEKTIARIAELQDFLKEIREARKKEEDLEIIKSIRSMKLGARDLFDLLTAIQDGNLSDELREQLLSDPEESEGDETVTDLAASDVSKRTGRKAEGKRDPDAEEDPVYEDGAMNAPEREENNNDKQHD